MRSVSGAQKDSKERKAGRAMAFLKTRLLFVWVSHQRAFHTSLYPRAPSKWQGTTSRDQRNRIPKGHVLILLVVCSTVDFKPFKATEGLHKKQPKAVLPGLK